MGPGDPAAGFDPILMNANCSDVICGTDPETLKVRWTGFWLQRRRTWRSASRLSAGKLKALGQLRFTRSELWPDLPKLTEQGLRGGVDFDMWFGLMAPAKTPPVVVLMLNHKVAQIVVEPEFRRQLSELGGVSPTSGNTIEALNEVIQPELAVRLKRALELGLKLD